jgi:hypothetical protein
MNINPTVQGEKDMTTSKQRVVIDFEANGDFFIYSDPEVEVICRHAHCTDDELYRYGHHPIPEQWLQGKPVGYRGDGSVIEKNLERLKEIIDAARGA